jgi:hypothetical protein
MQLSVKLYFGFMIAITIFLLAFLWRVTNDVQELRPPVVAETEQNLDRGKEERKKQNPITISRFMGRSYNQVLIQDVLNKMIHEGSALDLYWVRENVWSCRWERHGKKFIGLGLDPEDAIAATLVQALPAASPTQ